MKVVYYPKPCPGRNRNSLAIGFFDGLHRGHQKIICHAMNWGMKNQCPSVVVTFQNHPINVLEGKMTKPLLTRMAHKEELIRRLGPDICYVVPFTRSFSKKSPEQFVRDVLVRRLRARQITVGFNFCFGHKRAGNVELLKRLGREWGFQTSIAGPIRYTSKPISSSRIRKAVVLGNLGFASKMLGRPFSLMGTVIRGDGVGKKLGFPTANLQMNSDLLPPQGVYYVDVFLNLKRYAGLMNIGPRPKFLNLPKELPIKVEVYLLDFKKSIYRRTLFVEVIKKCRAEKIYFDPKKLIAQIGKDIQKARRIFQQRRKTLCYSHI